jgi:ATP-dependent Clp protease ATP-binding subunit ClpA
MEPRDFLRRDGLHVVLLVVMIVGMVLSIANHPAGYLLLVGLFVLVCVYVTLTVLLRLESPWLAGVYPTAGVKQLVDAVCWVNDDLPPDRRGLALKTTDDFHRAAGLLRGEFVANDALVDHLVDRLRAAVQSRGGASASAGTPPLAVFLLAGGEGTGKRFLVEQLARHLLRSGELPARIDLAELSRDNAWRELHRAVRRRPAGVVLLENVEKAAADLQQTTAASWTEGYFQAAACADNVFVLTTTAALDGLRAARARLARPEGWPDAAREALALHGSLDVRLLAAVHHFFLFEELSVLDRCEVVNRIVQRECLRENIRVQHVSTEYLSRLAGHFRPDVGFAVVRTLVRQELQPRIQQCKSTGQNQLHL